MSCEELWLWWLWLLRNGAVGMDSCRLLGFLMFVGLWCMGSEVCPLTRRWEAMAWSEAGVGRRQVCTRF